MRFNLFGKKDDDNNNNKNNNNDEFIQKNIKTIAMVINSNKASQVEEAAIRQIYNWLILCIQNGGNPDHVILALIKSYFEKQLNNQIPKYKILTRNFIKKLENMINEYFKLKNIPVANPSSLINKVVPQTQEEKEEQEATVTVTQSKKIINDSMEYWQKETESMVNHIKKTMSTFDCFDDKDMTEYDKIAANMIDASGRYTSLVSKFADKMLQFDSGK